jgi:type I restriction enzyme S subunit
MPRTSWSDLKRFKIFNPESDSAQYRIAYVLDTIDEAIAAAEAVMAKLKKVRAGMLHDLLSYGLDKNGQLRDPIAHPEKFKDSPLGRIPREWETKSLGTLCIHIGSGVTPRGGQDVYTKEGILFIRSQNVTFEGLKLGDIAYIPRHIHLGMLRSEVFAHDVLFNITGASIGRCCAMPDGMGQANVNQHVCILRAPEATEADALFLSTVLGSTIGQKQLDALNTCGNRQGLNYQQLGSFIVPWPEPKERHLIAEHVKETAAHLLKEIDEVTKLSSLKSGIQDDLLTGRVRVPETIMEGRCGSRDGRGGSRTAPTTAGP